MTMRCHSELYVELNSTNNQAEKFPPIRITSCVAVPFNAAELTENGLEAAAYNAEDMNVAESEIVSEHNAEEGWFEMQFIR